METFKDRLMKKIPTDDLKASLIITLLGTAGTIAEWLPTAVKLSDIPIEVRYALANITGNILAVISDHQVNPSLDLTNDYILGEQEQERAYRVYKKIVTMMYKDLQGYEEDLTH